MTYRYNRQPNVTVTVPNNAPRLSPGITPGVIVECYGFDLGQSQADVERVELPGGYVCSAVVCANSITLRCTAIVARSVTRWGHGDLFPR